MGKTANATFAVNTYLPFFNLQVRKYFSSTGLTISVDLAKSTTNTLWKVFSGLAINSNVLFFSLALYRSLMKKGPWAVHINLCSDRGMGGYLQHHCILPQRSAPCLHHHNPQQDIAHQHTRPVQA